MAHVDEKMASPEMRKYLGKLQEPISAGGVGRTVLGSLSSLKPLPPKPSPSPTPPSSSGTAKPPALSAPFTAVAAKASQEAWAKSLGKNVVEKNSIGMELVLIPPGEFLMGSPTTEADRSNDETQHRVRLTKPFWLGRTEVTQGQWQQVMGTTPWKGQSFVQEGADYAATYVSWEDAEEFCRKLSQRDGKTYRLPTEAEWEWSCRAGTTSRFSFGDSDGDLGRYAWFRVNAWDIGEKYAHRVGLKLANPFGLSDMHGNVREWCGDWYDAEFYGKVTGTAVDPFSASPAVYRVLRGGSWGFYAGVLSVREPRQEHARQPGRQHWFPGIEDSVTLFPFSLLPFALLPLYFFPATGAARRAR